MAKFLGSAWARAGRLPAAAGAAAPAAARLQRRHLCPSGCARS